MIGITKKWCNPLGNHKRGQKWSIKKFQKFHIGTLNIDYDPSGLPDSGIEISLAKFRVPLHISIPYKAEILNFQSDYFARHGPDKLTC